MIIAVDTPLGRDLQTLVAAAVQAPSIHNTQPWRFHASGHVLAVRADPGRGLGVTDPMGRELALSCGAAVFNARVAAAHLGCQVRTRLLPRSDQPALLATLTLRRGARPTRQEEALWAAIPRRHTNRLPFDDTAVPAEVLTALVDVARLEGCRVRVVQPPHHRELLALVAEAERAWTDRPDYRDELAQWIGDDGRRRDGIPAHARGPADRRGAVAVRDVSGVYTRSLRPASPFEHIPVLAVLATPGDRPRDWLRAGQALQAVLLTATSRGLQTSLMSQAVELPELRSLLRDRGSRPDHPHMVLRLGYGRDVEPTPRRPLAEVLTDD